MADFKLLSISIRIGTSVVRAISQETIDTHQTIARRVLDVEEPCSLIQIGGRTEIPLTWSDYTFEREFIHTKILERIGNNACDILIVDLSSSLLAKGPVPLVYCITAIEEAIKNGYCERALVLTIDKNPQNLGVRQYAHPDMQPRILILGQVDEFNEETTYFPLETQIAVADIYRQHLKSHTISPAEILTQKCIRRHGHFFNHHSASGEPMCSDTSYILRDCQQELVELLPQAISALGLPPLGFFVYDCVGTQDLAHACTTVAGKLGIPSCERLASVTSDTEFARSLSGSGILIVDFVASGRKVAEAYRTLQGLGLTMHTVVLAVVGPTKSIFIKSGSGEIQIKSLIIREMHLEHPRSKCPQCSLSIPVSNAAAEDDSNIDAYTMHKLVKSSGWEKEPSSETPANRRPYPFIPRFDKMLESAGEWLGYKVRRRMDELVRGEAGDPLVLHLDQRDANRIVELIQQSRKMEYSSLKVCPEALKDYDTHAGWATVLNNPSPSNREWVTKFLESRTDGVLIIDSFRASGRTIQKLHELLEIAKKRHLGTVTLIDFLQGENLPIQSLYTWHYPIHTT